MMRLRLFAVLMVAIFTLAGCFLRMERVPPLPKHVAPSGAYFVKPGMTREERLQDLASCGAHDGLMASFTKDETEEAERAERAKDGFILGTDNNGFIILRKKLEACMASKGYHKIAWGQCQGDKEYYPACMWP